MNPFPLAPVLSVSLSVLKAYALPEGCSMATDQTTEKDRENGNGEKKKADTHKLANKQHMHRKYDLANEHEQQHQRQQHRQTYDTTHENTNTKRKNTRIKVKEKRKKKNQRKKKKKKKNKRKKKNNKRKRKKKKKMKKAGKEY